MGSTEFTLQFIKRLKKISWAILLIALTGGGLFYYLAKRKIIVYTSKTTVFPLESSSDNISNSSISSILGLSPSAKSFSGEASVNIVELAMSRRIRENVVGMKVKELGNKTFAQLLIEENNKYTGFMQNEKIKMSKDSAAIIYQGGLLLSSGLEVKLSKNGTFELNFSNTNANLVRLISYALINKISEFYIYLKREKAQVDYNFAVKKVDSLQKVMQQLDAKQISLDETSFFTDQQLKRYSIPKINLGQEKQLIQQQYLASVATRESAAYRLQKETPVIRILDNPEPPYDASIKPTRVYTIIGLLLGAVLGIFIFTWNIILAYISAELKKMVNKPSEKPVESSEA